MLFASTVRQESAPAAKSAGAAIAVRSATVTQNTPLVASVSPSSGGAAGRLLSNAPRRPQAAYRREDTKKSALDISRSRQSHMSVQTIATILTILCFGIAFVCWAWLSIGEDRRRRRQRALEEDLGLNDPERLKQISKPEKLMRGWPLLGGRKG
jgi:hypothetical protein